MREEMNRAGAIELLMPSIQPKELWDETGRWEKFGGQLLKIKDRKDAWYCYGPTHEEVITDFARNELKSYKQLPVNFYQIQTKFRDEIRPRFGVMRAREFLMKDAYSFHLDAGRSRARIPQHVRRLRAHLHAPRPRVPRGAGRHRRDRRQREPRIPGARRFGRGRDRVLDRLGLRGEHRDGRSARAVGAAARAGAALERVDTPTQKTIDEVCAFLGVDPKQCVKTILVRGNDGLVALCVRGDHEINEVKAAKLAELAGRIACSPTKPRSSSATGAQAGLHRPGRTAGFDPGHRRPQRRRRSPISSAAATRTARIIAARTGSATRASRASPTSARSSKAMRRPTATAR